MFVLIVQQQDMITPIRTGHVTSDVIIPQAITLDKVVRIRKIPANVRDIMLRGIDQ